MNRFFSFKSICSVIIVFFFSIISTYAQNTNTHKDSGQKKGKSNVKIVDPDQATYSNSGWQLGIGFGLYKAGNQSANYYNGSGKNSLRRNLIDNTYNYQALKDRFNFDFVLDSNNLPSNMKYSPAIMLQAVSKYNFDENNGFVIDVGYAKLTTSDVFTLILNDPSNTTSDPTVQLGKIWGDEERVNFNFGYIRSFGKPQKMKPYFELGVNVNDTKLKDNKAQVLTFTYSIVDPTDVYYGYKQGGIGYGYYVGTGLIFNLGDAFAAHFGANFSMKKINILPDPGYSKEFVIYFRLMYKNLFGSNKA